MVKIIAHRGASREEPENTLKAIRKAIEIGVDYIEIDVHLSRDGVPVVIHDDTLCRTTNAEKGKKIRETELDHLKRYDAGSWFHGVETEERVPTLEEVLALNFNGTGLMIEIKDDVRHDLSSAVFSRIQRCSVRQLLVGSFSPESLKYFHKKYPRFQLIGIMETWDMASKFAAIDVERIAVDHSIISSPLDDELKKQFSEIWAYSIDDPLRKRELASFGVQGIITNDPRGILVP